MISTLLTIQGSINLLQHGQSLIVHKEEQHSFAGSGYFPLPKTQKLSFYPSSCFGTDFSALKTPSPVLSPQIFVPWLTMGATT